MAAILGKLSNALLIGLLAMVAVIVAFHGGLIAADAGSWVAGFLRVIHVWAGILWIGLLYYFNFVQIPSMPKIPDEQKPAIGKVIAPTALYYFRYAALGTVVFGLLTAYLSDYLHQAMSFQEGWRTIGIGMWLALIMAANVWFLIWPNQKRALGIVEADADTKKKSARIAMLVSRTNTMLSIPMLYCMVFQKIG